MKAKTKMLLAYSASAVGYLSIANKANAQAVYTDLDPDSVWLPLETWFYTSDDILYIDMDNNSDKDFKFLNLSFFWDFSFSTFDEYRQRVAVGRADYGADLGNNFIAGTTMSYWTAYGYAKRAYPYAISSGVNINSDLQFVGGGYQQMAFRTYSHWYGEEDTIFWTNPHGNWYPEPGDTLDNKYLGVKFLGGDGFSHFGWIRCSVIDNHEEGFILIVKDYAYESKPDTPIAAGDTIGDTTVVIIENLLENIAEEVQVYSFGKKIYIIVSKYSAEVNIYSVTGERLYEQELNAGKAQIDFSHFASGVYFVEVTSGENKAMKKVWIE